MALSTLKLRVTAVSISLVRFVSAKNCFLGVNPMLNESLPASNFDGRFKAFGIGAGLKTLHAVNDTRSNEKEHFKIALKVNLKILILRGGQEPFLQQVVLF